MSKAQDVQKGLYAWAMSHSVLSDDAMRDAMNQLGDASLIPFDDAYANFFKTRKIVKISRDTKSRATRFSLATRLPIAQSKREKLISAFASRFAKYRFSLELVVDRAFKIDQNVQSTFNPVYLHRGRIACGSSVGLGNQRNAGTLTALCEDAEGKLLGISCNHVTGGCSTASIGTPIVCPGIQDVSPDNHEITVIGLHVATGPMSQGLPQVLDISSNCDLALFELNDSRLVTSMQGTGEGSFDTPDAFAKAHEDTLVKKWGRSTDLTQGVISKIVTEPESIEYNVVSYYGPTSSQIFKGTVYFSELYEVESLNTNPFSAGGDSGSLVVTDDGKAERIIGILIGGNNLKSYVLPLKNVLKKLKVQIIGGLNT